MCQRICSEFLLMCMQALSECVGECWFLSDACNFNTYSAWNLDYFVLGLFLTEAVVGDFGIFT